MEPDWRQIEREHPGLSIGAVRRLGEGWMSVAYLVNDELVVKVPKRRETWDDLHQEAAVLAYAAVALPLGVPRYVKLVPDSPAAEFGYATYEYVRGDALDLSSLGAGERAAAAAAIAGFLRTLHGLALPPHLAARIPRDNPRIAEEYLAKAKRFVAPALTARERRALIDRLEAILSDLASTPRADVLLHADLSLDHILVRDRAVHGVIDFGDVAWGDPDYDFMYLFVDAGPAFVREVALRYEHHDFERLMHRVEHYAILDQIDTIVHGPGRALDGQIEGAWGLLRDILHRGHRR